MEATWTSILPPLVAIIAALTLRQVIPSLLFGILAGAFLLHGVHLYSVARIFDEYMIDALSNRDHVYVMLFTLFIGGMVSLLNYNGGMTGIVEVLSEKVSSARSARVVTYFLGLLIFFDDYANSMIIGNSMRPLTDRFKVSREKLAYIVDSTAAPLAAIAFITTWVGAEIGYINDSIQHLNINESGYSIFISSLQYSFYPILTLVFVFLISWTGKDFGPMHKAEKNMENTHLEGEKVSENNNPQNAILPILTLIIITFLGLIISGLDNIGKESYNLSEIIGAANAYASLLWGSFSALTLALLLTWKQDTSFNTSMNKAIDGFKHMVDTIVILGLAWTLAIVIEKLDTSAFLSLILKDAIDPAFYSLIIFLLAGITSFATGSSWGTMAILYPIALPLCGDISTAHNLEHEQMLHLIYLTSASVLGGAVFGDHCSPISDTTILSSSASGCNHLSHVKTQIPYALICGIVSCITIVCSFWISISLLNFAIGIAILFGVIHFLGKKSS